MTVFGIPGVSGATVPQLVVEEPRHQKGIQGKQSLEENDVMVKLKGERGAIEELVLVNTVRCCISSITNYNEI